MYITLEDGERPETPSAEHDFKPNGVCADCGAHNDLPTLPLRLQQTSGGYKAIEDAEGRHVTFVAMREDDRAWGEFLLNRVNNFDALRELASLLITNAEMIPDPRREGATDCYAVTLDDLEALQTALVDGPQNQEVQ